ncbi:MAG: type IX secretion system protein PorQ [Ignavibacteriae bacterium]|nr:type IX secretion system protein PorQ [Ignavibacteriota bacterium]MCB9242940.1 type IX secretion system protein PorQ [Ignavibacteriales bacterium]
MRSTFLSLFFITLFTLFSGNQTYSQSDKVYNFLNLDVDARSSALAGSVISSENELSAIFYNPGGIATLTETKASVGFFKYLLDVNSGNAAFGMKYKDKGYFAAGLRFVSYGSFQKFDEQYNEIGTFSATDMALSLGYSNFFTPQLSYGVALKIIYSNIDEYNSAGIATDWGLLYRMPNQSLNIGISLLNLGTQLSSYGDTKEDLPLNLKIGASKSLEYLPLTFNVALNNLTQETDSFFDRFKYVTLGGDFKFSENFHLRVGYNNQLRQDLKTGSTTGIGGFSAGLGFRFLTKYELDYAFNSLGQVGATHRINVGFKL